MAKQIWMLSFENCVGFKGTSFVCKESVSTRPGGSCGGVELIFDGSPTGIGEKSAFASVVSSADPSQCPPGYPFYEDVSAGCAPTSINPNQACDCVNGGCVPKTTYGTPGKFPNLAACQSACAKDSNCEGECVSSTEIAALQQAANKAKANCCK
jgi:hypothetical protein